MPRWLNHTLCRTCWDDTHPASQQLYQVRDAESEPCCRCGKPTSAGIYVRQQADAFPCNGSCEEA